MLYFLDCEFNGFCGELISLALSGEAGELYLVRTGEELAALDLHPWVEEHVMPILSAPGAAPSVQPLDTFGRAIQKFLEDDPSPAIVADWPEDLAHLMRCLIIGPGRMIAIRNMQLSLIHAPLFPHDIEGAVLHNALWDARLLRHAREMEGGDA